MPLLSSFTPYGSLRRDDDIQRQQAAQLAPTPPLCLTGVICEDSTLTVHRTLADGTNMSCSIRYLVFRPRLLKYDKIIKQQPPPPLVVIHGGPGVPSNYLHPLVHLVTDRALVFYDQLGCGRSSRTKDASAYSIELFVQDLEALIHDELNLSEFHLYGHSFGGILAFEYLKNNYNNGEFSREHKCLSLILSSTPTSIALVEEESKKLLEAIIQDQDDNEKEEDIDYDDKLDDKDTEEIESRRTMETFRQLHECRVVPIPVPLLDAYSQTSDIWFGTKAIPDYVATCSDDCAFPPALLLRGQHDFVSQKCIKGWHAILDDCQTMVLAGCSHYGLLENEQLYGDVLLSHFAEYDPQEEEDSSASSLEE